MEREEPIYKHGLYITVSDQTAFEHYHGLHSRGGTQHLPDENLRRYRFSVVVNKLTETLYRLGYELEKDGEFGSQEKICTTAGEPGDDTVLKTAGEIMRAYGNVERAMREAITHAFGVSSFSFFSEALTIHHYKFNVQELQWFILFKNKGKANKEMIQVMHYHGVEYVPLFQEHVDKAFTRDTNEPVRLKFLANTPLAQRQGINMLMPVPAHTARTGGAAASTSIDLPEETAILEATLDDTNPKPDPPDDPIIEDPEEEEEEAVNVAGEDEPMIGYDGGDENDERVASGPVRSEPVVLEPVRPVPVVLKARPKPASASAPFKEDVRDRAGTSSSASSTVIAPKARPPESKSRSDTAPTSTPSPRTSAPAASASRGTGANPSQTPESTSVSAACREVARIDLTDQTSSAMENMGGDYTGSLADVRDPINEIDPRVPIPTPSPARSKGGRDRQHQQEWRPSVPETSGISSSSRPWRPNQAPARRNAGNRVRWASTRIYGNTEGAWRELWRRYPNVAGGEWFVRERF